MPIGELQVMKLQFAAGTHLQSVKKSLAVIHSTNLAAAYLTFHSGFQFH
jgi:hypothetical protein